MISSARSGRRNSSDSSLDHIMVSTRSRLVTIRSRIVESEPLCHFQLTCSLTGLWLPTRGASHSNMELRKNFCTDRVDYLRFSSCPDHLLAGSHPDGRDATSDDAGALSESRMELWAPCDHEKA